MLSDGDRARLEHYCAPRRRIQFLAGRQLLTTLAAQALETPVALATQKSGRPLATTRSGQSWPCSISHSGDWLVAGFHPQGTIGVDLEVARPGRKVAAAIQRFFPPKTWNMLCDWPEEDIEEWFYQQWCAREAVMKCLGRGNALQMLGQSLDSFGALGSASARLNGSHRSDASPLFIDVRWRPASEETKITTMPRCYEGSISASGRIVLAPGSVRFTAPASLAWPE